MSITDLHAPIPVEASLDAFVRSVGGARVADSLGRSPEFENADYVFGSDSVIAELKECETEFGNNESFREKHFKLSWEYVDAGLMHPFALLRRDPLPPEYVRDFLRLFRPQVARILKKANRQIKSTREALSMPKAHGVLFFVNDGFTGLEPHFVNLVATDILSSSYRAIDCFIYMTVNTYVRIPSSDYAHLLWMPSYSPSAPDALVTFVDTLGKRWFEFLEERIGPWDVSLKTDDRTAVHGSKVIGQGRQAG